MRERPGPSFSAEVITRTVWDPVEGAPDVADLHRDPLRALGEGVRLERIPTMCAAVALAGAGYLGRATGAPTTHGEVSADDIAAAE